MQAMVCELCGSNDIVKQDGLYVCQHCGTKYTIEEAKKLIGTVKIDTSEEIVNLQELARRAFREKDHGYAASLYTRILEKDPTDAEASFYSALCKAYACKVAEIPSECEAVGNRLKTTLRLIKEKTKEEDQYRVCKQYVSDFCDVEKFLHKAVYNTLIENIGNNVGLNLYQRFDSNWGDAAFGVAEELLSCFGYKDLAASVYMAFKATTSSSRKVEAYNKAIQLDPSLAEKTSAPIAPAKKSGCYVATAVYGSYDCPEVWTLRRYRDITLAGTWYGRTFIRIYYAISPTLVKWFGKRVWFKNLWKPFLDKLVLKLNKSGLEDTPYQDKKW